MSCRLAAGGTWMFSGHQLNWTGLGCPLQPVTAGIKIDLLLSGFSGNPLFSTESWGGYNPVSNKWNDTELHSVVIKVPVFLCVEFGTIPLRRAHSGGARAASFCTWGKKQPHHHVPPCGNKGGFDGKESLLLFWKEAHNRATNLQWGFPLNVLNKALFVNSAVK